MKNFNDSYMKEVFIIGSGNSLNNLTPEEIKYINTKETISLNRYPIFQDFIGIVPKHNVYLDNNSKTKNVLENLFRVLQKSQSKTKLYFYSDIIHGVTTPRGIFPPHKDFIESNNTEWFELKSRRKPDDFAINIDDFFYARTTLGCGLNLARVLYGENIKVKCLGIDGGGNFNFYTKLLHYLNSNALCDKALYDLIEPGGSDVKHSSWAFQPILNNDFVKYNRFEKIYVCNKNSNAINNGLFEYCDIIEDRVYE